MSKSFKIFVVVLVFVCTMSSSVLAKESSSTVVGEKMLENGVVVEFEITEEFVQHDTKTLGKANVMSYSLETVPKKVYGSFKLSSSGEIIGYYSLEAEFTFDGNMVMCTHHDPDFLLWADDPWDMKEVFEHCGNNSVTEAYSTAGWKLLYDDDFKNAIYIMITCDEDGNVSWTEF